MKIKINRDSKIISAILVFALIVGVALLLYPTVSEKWNQAHQTVAIARYEDQVQTIKNPSIDEQIQMAHLFNERLNEAPDKMEFIQENRAEYESLLNVGDGIMGYVEIPPIKTTLSLYHGTSEAVLQVATGHVEWSSLPVGGNKTHSIISGHSGLTSARLFDRLEDVDKGDSFQVHIGGEVLHYEVDQIKVVKPDDTSSLMPQEGKDYCTLVTCTPYGVNSHRLLVRGHRIDFDNTFYGAVTADGSVVNPWRLFLYTFMLILGLLSAANYKNWNIRSSE